MVQARRREDGLDETDRLIVAELQENARISNVELAKRVNLSPTPCYERVRKLGAGGQGEVARKARPEPPALDGFRIADCGANTALGASRDALGG